MASAVAAETKALAARLEALEAENQRLGKVLGLMEAYHAAAARPPAWLMPKKRIVPGAATACVQLSDLHLDENVNPAEVGGLNAYSRPIAEMRLRKTAIKACEMGDRHRHKWDGAVAFWGGDMVSGAIHEELRETNADVLPGTIMHWAPLLASALRTIADFYGKLHVACVTGNHGRLTVKMQAKRRGRNSWDWLLSQMVRAHLQDDKRITWTIADGSYLFVPIYGRHAYLTHGDEVKGGNGWAGVWSPLGTIHRRGVELAAAHGLQIAYAVVGHWHQCVLAHQRGLVCNGAGKGWDEYAAAMRFRPEPASQNWWVETPEYGTTLAGPLFVEDRKAEGW